MNTALSLCGRMRGTVVESPVHDAAIVLVRRTTLREQTDHAPADKGDQKVADDAQGITAMVRSKERRRWSFPHPYSLRHAGMYLWVHR